VPAAGTLVAAIAAIVAVVPATPASAQFFDFLFGAVRRAAPPRSASAYVDPNPRFNPYERPPERHTASAPWVVYCVRLCDGRFFPIQRSHGANAAQICNSFCPAATTKLYSGNKIDYAVAKDGTRYSALPNAFVYRKRPVDGCTCNGRDAFGTVNDMTAAEDPTLRKGDIVVTNTGFVAYQGGHRQNAEFTPVESYPGLSADRRRKLAETKIRAAAATPIPPDLIRERLARRRQVQLER
jgi:Protein of unknown function (DUF2865)